MQVKQSDRAQDFWTFFKSREVMMTISQLAFDTIPQTNHSTVQHSKPNQQAFASALNQAQESSTERTYEAREVLRLLQDCMLGLLSGQGEEMEFLSSYNLVRPFTPAGYNAYQTPAATSVPMYPSSQPVYAPPVVEETDQPAAPQPNTLRVRIENLIDQVAERVGLPANLIRSVVSTESSFKHDAVSPVGAQGLMQLMPRTAEELGVNDSFDPQQNLLGGSRYLKGLLEKYDGDLDHALAAYNWGQGNVDRKGLEHMPTETRNYIAKVKQVVSQFG
ncbi:MAG: hypothetical protein BA874_09900 [Desulfuromonadales bacterium C00003068]|nr:MAG: hypothetical protein BA874_09900 [Desulfuromonadales bacterium C00003068]